MKFSTRTTYGIRAMIRLARRWGQGATPLSYISESEKISLGYLERLFSKLMEVKLVISEKGASGGYKLSKSPDRINMYDIVSALEGKMSLFHCISKEKEKSCRRECECGASAVLVKVQKAIRDTLRKIRLSELL
jgi:Rrf2 family cysteine metabolism transcriptional repressor